jgi:hypothetical protein
MICCSRELQDAGGMTCLDWIKMRGSIGLASSAYPRRRKRWFSRTSYEALILVKVPTPQMLDAGTVHAALKDWVAPERNLEAILMAVPEHNPGSWGSCAGSSQNRWPHIRSHSPRSASGRRTDCGPCRHDA